MKPHEKYAEEIIADIEKYDSAHASDSLIGSYYHDKKQMAIYVIKKQIEIMDEWYYDKKFYKKAIEYLNRSDMNYSEDWIIDSIDCWGKVLTGIKGHWCPGWDYLPIDETCPEFKYCQCNLKTK